MSQPAVTDYFKIQKKESKAKISVLEKQTVRDELTKVLSEAGIPAIPIKKEVLSQNLRDIQDSLKKVFPSPGTNFVRVVIRLLAEIL